MYDGLVHSHGIFAIVLLLLRGGGGGGRRAGSSQAHLEVHRKTLWQKIRSGKHIYHKNHVNRLCRHSHLHLGNAPIHLRHTKDPFVSFLILVVTNRVCCLPIWLHYAIVIFYRTPFFCVYFIDLGKKQRTSDTSCHAHPPVNAVPSYPSSYTVESTT